MTQKLNVILSIRVESSLLTLLYERALLESASIYYNKFLEKNYPILLEHTQITLGIAIISNKKALKQNKRDLIKFLN